MAKGRRSGKKNLGLTRNQRRKQAYASMAETRDSSNKKKGGASDRRAALRTKRQSKIKMNDHQAGQGPACRNIGCRRCFPEINKETRWQVLHPKSLGDIKRARRQRICERQRKFL